MSESESAARKAAAKLYGERQWPRNTPMDKICLYKVCYSQEEAEEIISAACQTAAPPPDLFKPYRGDGTGGELEAIEAALKFVDECVSRRRCDAEAISECVRCTAVYLAKIVKQLKRGAAPAVSTPPDSWRSLIGPEAEEHCWERMCKSFHDKIADVLGLPHEPEPGFEPMLVRIKQLIGAAVSTPRCPKCHTQSFGVYMGKAQCGSFDCQYEGPAAEFFQPAPSPPCEPICTRCGYRRGLHSEEPPYDLHGENDDYCEGFSYIPVASPQGEKANEHLQA